MRQSQTITEALGNVSSRLHSHGLAPAPEIPLVIQPACQAPVPVLLSLWQALPPTAWPGEDSAPSHLPARLHAGSLGYETPSLGSAWVAQCGDWGPRLQGQQPGLRSSSLHCRWCLWARYREGKDATAACRAVRGSGEFAC